MENTVSNGLRRGYVSYIHQINALFTSIPDSVANTAYTFYCDVCFHNALSTQGNISNWYYCNISKTHSNW